MSHRPMTNTSSLKIAAAYGALYMRSSQYQAVIIYNCYFLNFVHQRSIKFIYNLLNWDVY